MEDNPLFLAPKPDAWAGFPPTWKTLWLALLVAEEESLDHPWGTSTAEAEAVAGLALEAPILVLLERFLGRVFVPLPSKTLAKRRSVSVGCGAFTFLRAAKREFVFLLLVVLLLILGAVVFFMVSNNNN